MHSIPKFNGTYLLMHQEKIMGFDTNNNQNSKVNELKMYLYSKVVVNETSKELWLPTYLLNFFTVLLHKKLIIISSFNCQLQIHYPISYVLFLASTIEALQKIYYSNNTNMEPSWCWTSHRSSICLSSITFWFIQENWHIQCEG